MKKKIFAVVLCLIVLTSAIVPAYAVSPDFDVPAKFIYLVNTDTDTVVYEKNAEERAIPASLTKIMTAIIALQKTQNLDAMDIKAPGYIYNEFYGIGVSNAEIARGEVFTMRELLYALMLNSACEAASIIADYVGGGSIPSFVEMMNEKAKEIGALNTNFVNAHGLYDENQYTTAHDMYLITKYALEQPGFLEIANTKNYTIEGNELRTTK
ncbi:MAG TPA: D-alanyl-D-alanine carboxypeptidase, partial [Ruminococcaceae bacterium]|nr:D-alanyl-D-alanine carboxypeptidase [Oscillospiraceae bacterium]